MNPGPIAAGKVIGEVEEGRRRRLGGGSKGGKGGQREKQREGKRK
jgi:hypothetical protein